MEPKEYETNGLRVRDFGAWQTREQLVGRVLDEASAIFDNARKIHEDAKIEDEYRKWAIGFYIAQMHELDRVMDCVLGIKVLGANGERYTDEMYDRMHEWKIAARKGARGETGGGNRG